MAQARNTKDATEYKTMKKGKKEYQFTWLDCLVLITMVAIGNLQTLFTNLKRKLK